PYWRIHSGSVLDPALQRLLADLVSGFVIAQLHHTTVAGLAADEPIGLVVEVAHGPGIGRSSAGSLAQAGALAVALVCGSVASAVGRTRKPIQRVIAEVCNQRMGARRFGRVIAGIVRSEQVGAIGDTRLVAEGVVVEDRAESLAEHRGVGQLLDL